MKKVIFLGLIIFALPLKVLAISASSAIVMDLNSDQILFSQNISERKLIASTTKIMTAYVAIKYGDINKVVVVDKEVLKAYGSAIYIEVGEKLKLIDLLYGLILRSGNDAAIIIANNISKNMDEFVKLMNKEATNIGMKNTIFLNNHGLEDENGDGNMSTAYDMAILMREAMKLDIFREIVSTKKYTVKTNFKTYVWTNKNKLLHSYPYITGGKTGYTKKARRTLVTTAKKDNMNLVIVTLNDPNDFKDHKDLYEKYFKMYHAVLVIDKNNFKILTKYNKKNVKTYVKNDYYALIKNGDEKKISVKYNILNDVKITKDTYIGSADIYLGDTLLYKEKIFATKEKNNGKKSLWQKIKGWFS